MYRGIPKRCATLVVLALCTGAGITLSATTAAYARNCAAQAVTTSGEPASFRWLALLKARGDWRIRVRSQPALGPDYADWSNAADIVEKCVSSEESVACTVTARPCKP